MKKISTKLFLFSLITSLFFAYSCNEEIIEFTSETLENTKENILNNSSFEYSYSIENIYARGIIEKSKDEEIVNIYNKENHVILSSTKKHSSNFILDKVLFLSDPQNNVNIFNSYLNNFSRLCDNFREDRDIYYGSYIIENKTNYIYVNDEKSYLDYSYNNSIDKYNIGYFFGDIKSFNVTTYKMFLYLEIINQCGIYNENTNYVESNVDDLEDVNLFTSFYYASFKCKIKNNLVSEVIASYKDNIEDPIVTEVFSISYNNSQISLPKEDEVIRSECNHKLTKSKLERIDNKWYLVDYCVICNELINCNDALFDSKGICEGIEATISYFEKVDDKVTIEIEVNPFTYEVIDVLNLNLPTQVNSHYMYMYTKDDKEYFSINFYYAIYNAKTYVVIYYLDSSRNNCVDVLINPIIDDINYEISATDVIKRIICR